MIVVDTEHAGGECGDIMAAETAGVRPPERVTTLPEAVGADGGLKRPAGCLR